MKVRVSATIDKASQKIINDILKEGKYRNKSHVIEEAIKLFSKKIEEENEK